MSITNWYVEIKPPHGGFFLDQQKRKLVLSQDNEMILDADFSAVEA